MSSVMTAHARWNLVVSQSTDDTLRQFLASQGRGRKGELSRFVEDAVRSRILELEVDQAKAENSGTSAATIENAIDEALEWARRA
jgi:Ribbon-helix-helix domain